MPAGSTASTVVDVLEPLADGDYQLTLVVQKASSGLKDTLNALMAIPNLIALLALSPIVVQLTRAGLARALQD